jgi:hypothetical protein
MKELKRVNKVRRICPTAKGTVNEALRCAVDTYTVELTLPLGWAMSHLEVYRFVQ